MYFVSTLDLSYNEIKIKFYTQRKENNEKTIIITTTAMTTATQR